MSDTARRQLLAGARITSLGTLASRVLGMLRDMATASLLGTGTVMDAFVIALRIPNMFRRLFGEGAFAAGYLPVITSRLADNRREAWQLFTVTLFLLAAVLAVVVVLCEMICGVLYWWLADEASIALLIGLSSVLIPYLFFICIAAQLSATLHALGHFTWPAFVPVLFNILWLLGVWFAATWVPADKHAQAYVLALCVLLAGPIQAAPLLAVVRKFGGRIDYHWANSRPYLTRILRTTIPMMLGLAITQINTLLDSLIAWSLAYDPAVSSSRDISWLGGLVEYPLKVGAASAIYFGERLYQFPLGILGMAIATAIFPLLSRHAAEGQLARVGNDLSYGLRLALFLGLPASVGLVLMAEPIARLLFERGEFGSDSTARTARMIACYGVGVWAYCASAVLIRGYYALFDFTRPVVVGGWMVVANLLMNLLLIWPLGEAGLAVSTSISASVHVSLLAWLFSRNHVDLQWSKLRHTTLRTTLAAICMAAATWLCLHAIGPGDTLTGRVLTVMVPIAAGMVVFAVAAWLLGLEEMRHLTLGSRESHEN